MTTNNALLSAVSTTPAVVAILTLIWAAGITYQRIISLEAWRDQVQGHIVTPAQLESQKTDYDTKMKAMEMKFENEIRIERAFSRSLCVALTHTQQAAKIPVTNDCARP